MSAFPATKPQPSLGDIILRRSRMSGLEQIEYFHSVLYIGVPSQFEHLLPRPIPEGSVLRSVIPHPLQDEPYVIHFSGTPDSPDAVAGALRGVFSDLGLQAGGAPEERTSEQRSIAKVCITPFSAEIKPQDTYSIHTPLSTEPCVFSPEDTVKRAFALLGEGFGAYDLKNHNCQHFVTQCKYGREFLLPEQTKLLATQVAGVMQLLMKSLASPNTPKRP